LEIRILAIRLGIGVFGGFCDSLDAH